MKVTKRNGSKSLLDINKIHKVVEFACEDIKNVSASDLEIRSKLQFYDGITTYDIQETLIKAAADLISEDSPEYQEVAGRLINYHVRKIAYSQYNPPPLKDHIKNVTKAGFYTKEFFIWYSNDEIDIIDSYIRHDRDNSIKYVGWEQFRGKYLVKNRITGKIYETPQFVYILIAMVLFNKCDKNIRLEKIKDFYDNLSTFVISLPSPILAGVRTPLKQFSSCVLIDCGDSLDSINATSNSIVKYIAQRAGIGLNIGRIRTLGSPIRNGEVTHTGVIPFLKLFEAAVNSCNQGGLRKGSCTVNYPIWRLDYEDLIVLKNNKGTEESRVRHLDYVVQFNQVMYERLLSGGNITLFSPSDVPGLYESFFIDVDKFRALYEKYEADPKIRKKSIKAIDAFSLFVQERKDTGRIYLMNVDHCNNHGSFIKDKAPIFMTNLCVEVTEPTVPLKSDKDGEIALCSLAAINWGKIKTPKDFEKPCRIIVDALNALLDYQDYPVLEAEYSTYKRRMLGIGIIDFAHWLAKQGLEYQNINKEGLNIIHEWAEAWSYYIIKASISLAKEENSGNTFFEGYSDTKWSEGLFPIDTYKKEVDTLVDPIYKMDWDVLRNDIKIYGIKNSCLMSLMPSESSSQISNATNGIEPPRSLISIKQSKEGVLKQVVPEIKKYHNKYDLLWSQKSPQGYLKIVAVLQKFIDQSISTNISYNPQFYLNNEIPMSDMIKDILLAYKWGIKTLYYNNTYDGAGEIETKDCEACKI